MLLKKPQPRQLGRQKKKRDKNSHGKLFGTDNLYWNNSSISRLHALTQGADNFERFEFYFIN